MNIPNTNNKNPPIKVHRQSDNPPTKEEMTVLYLYGAVKPPADRTDEALIRPQ